MRGWYRPSDGRWIEVGDHPRYDHAASLSDHDGHFRGVLRDTAAGTVLLPCTVAPEPGDEVVCIHDVEDIVGGEPDPNDVAVSMGWVRVNCARSVTTIPYLHAGSEGDLTAGVAFVRSRGVDLARAERAGFGGAFSGNVIAIDMDDGSQRHVEYGLSRGGRLVAGRVVEYGGTPTPRP